MIVESWYNGINDDERTTMDINDMIARLEEARDQGVEEVLVATQPSWPLAFHVADVVMNEERNVTDDEREDDHHAGDDVVWIVTGSQPDDPYAPRDVFESNRW